MWVPELRLRDNLDIIHLPPLHFVRLLLVLWCGYTLTLVLVCVEDHCDTDIWYPFLWAPDSSVFGHYLDTIRLSPLNFFRLLLVFRYGHKSAQDLVCAEDHCEIYIFYWFLWALELCLRNNLDILRLSYVKCPNCLF